MLDTNMILRFLLKDNVSMAFKTAEHIENDNVIITVEVIAEVVYVLLKVYSLEREKISEVVINFVELVHCHEHDEVVLALAKFEKSNLDFVNCMLYAYHKLNGVEIATFDKQLIKILSIE